jgi:hypothetical protein
MIAVHRVEKTNGTYILKYGLNKQIDKTTGRYRLFGQLCRNGKTKAFSTGQGVVAVYDYALWSLQRSG